MKTKRILSCGQLYRKGRIVAILPNDDRHYLIVVQHKKSKKSYNVYID